MSMRDDPAAVMAQFKKYGSVAAMARATGSPESTVRDKVRRAKSRMGNGAPVVVVDTAPSSKKTLATFRKEHDISWKIRDGLKRLFAGESYMSDSEFREAVQANPARWRVYSEANEFAGNRIRVRGEWLWASQKTIAAMKQILGIA